MAVVLILALTTSPAFAAICATSCASKSIMSAVNPDGMSTMMNCHKGVVHTKTTSTDKSGIEHKSCAMGAGCHFSQATPIDSSSSYAFIDSIPASFPRFDVSEKSVDLSPPLKPPA